MRNEIERLTDCLQSANRKAKTSESELAFILQEAVDILKDISPIKRRSWIEAQLHELYNTQRGKCAICRKNIAWGYFHVDHKIPYSKGGGNEFTNLQLTHPLCNQSKGNGVSFSDLLLYLESRVMNL